LILKKNMEINKKIVFTLFAFILINFINAECEEGQIDINSATIEELDSLTGVGLIKAEAIIDGKPYDSINGLTDVYGIGESTLEKIKEQGLACIEEEQGSEEKTEEVEEESFVNEEIEDVPERISANITLNPIVLTAQNIKSGEDKEFSKKDLALCGVIGFCVVFGALLLKKRKYKNEFQ